METKMGNETRFKDYNKKLREKIQEEITKFILVNVDADEELLTLRSSISAGLRSKKDYLKFWLEQMEKKSYPNSIPYDVLLPKDFAIFTRKEASSTGSNLDIIPDTGKYSYSYCDPNGFSADWSDKWFPSIRATVNAVITGEDKDLIPNKECTTSHSM